MFYSLDYILFQVKLLVWLSKDIEAKRPRQAANTSVQIESVKDEAMERLDFSSLHIGSVQHLTKPKKYRQIRFKDVLHRIAENSQILDMYDDTSRNVSWDRSGVL